MDTILILGLRFLATTQGSMESWDRTGEQSAQSWELSYSTAAWGGPGEGQATLEAEDSWSGHLSYAIGVKFLESSWTPVRVQGEYGLFDGDLHPPGWPFWLAMQFLFTTSDSLPNSLRDDAFFQDETSKGVATYEFNVGIRELWELSPGVQLFAGGGVSVIGAFTWMTLGDPGGRANDTAGQATVGVWASTGAYVDLGLQMQLGLQLEYSWGEVSLLDHRMNAGGVHALLMFGYHW